MSEQGSTRHPAPNIPIAPGSWSLKASHVYTIPFYTSSKATAGNSLPSFARHPSESPSINGNFRGGLGMVQVLRYTESPVGAYDEMLIVPGYFDVEVPEFKDGQKGEVLVGEPGGGGESLTKKKNVRVSRIYVSTKASVWNGRRNWNVPKHLASFSFKEDVKGGMNIQVFPVDEVTGEQSTKPFFSATYKFMKYIPWMSCSTNWAKWVGLDLRLVQPPLPTIEGCESDQREESVLVGTKEWCSLMPVQKTRKMGLGWWDMLQDGERSTGQGNDDDDDNGLYSSESHWWPGWGRWRLGMGMEDTEVVFEEGIKWKL